MYILTLTHTCPQDTNNIICTHKNIHKIYNILIQYVHCTYTLCVHEHILICNL